MINDIIESLVSLSLSELFIFSINSASEDEESKSDSRILARISPRSLKCSVGFVVSDTDKTWIRFLKK